MSPTPTSAESPASLVIEYRLTEEDVRRHALASRLGKSLRCCAGRKFAVVALASLALSLVAICYQARGIRPAARAAVTALAVVVGLAWARQAGVDRHACRLAGQLGLPRDFRLVASPEGIVEEPVADSFDPSRSYRWSEVVEVDRVGASTALRLRRGGSLLLIPDRAFPTPLAIEKFAEQVRAWRKPTPR